MDAQNTQRFTIKNIQEADQAFRFDLFSQHALDTTFQSLVGVLPNTQLQPLLMQQYNARFENIDVKYPQAIHFIVQASTNQKPIGYFCIAEERASFRLVELLLMKESRGMGIGTELLEYVKSFAVQVNKYVECAVHKENTQAFALYKKNGFSIKDEYDTYWVMTTEK